jgi:hypothetical protein
MAELLADLGVSSHAVPEAAAGRGKGLGETRMREPDDDKNVAIRT